MNGLRKKLGLPIKSKSPDYMEKRRKKGFLPKLYAFIFSLYMFLKFFVTLSHIYIHTDGQTWYVNRVASQLKMAAKTKLTLRLL